MPKKKLLSDYIIEDIKVMLQDGKLKEGEKLPNQNEFAEQLGVSRVSLREALRKLELMGVVQQRPKTGTVILNGNVETWGSPLKRIELKDEADTRQMLLARQCVELTIALEAGKHITENQLHRLTEIYYEMYDTYRASNIEGYLAKDKEFHMHIAGACGNRYLREMYAIALSQVDIFMKDVFLAIPEAFEKTVRLHRGIYEALAERNEDKIKRSMSRHAVYISELLSRFFNRGADTESGPLYYP